jgi:UDP-glucose 4-epimerase
LVGQVTAGGDPRRGAPGEDTAVRTLVTGGAGFIGSNLVHELLLRGHEVRVLDNFSTGRRDNLGGVLADVDLVEGDLRSYERVHRAVKGCEVVFHHGALLSVAGSILDPLATNEVNIGGTLNVLLAARDEGVRRVVSASSSSIYGSAPGLPHREDATPRPLAPYAVSKLAAEHYCRIATQIYRLEVVSLRYFNVFGEHQDPRSAYSAVLPRFIDAMQNGRSPTVFGDGQQSRDFIYVANVVVANLLAAHAPAAAGETLNIGSGEQRSVNALVWSLNDLLGTRLAPTYVEARPGEVQHSLADIGRARELLGYRPVVDFEDGLRAMIKSDDGRRARPLAARDLVAP